MNQQKAKKIRKLYPETNRLMTYTDIEKNYARKKFNQMKNRFKNKKITWV